MTAILEKRSCEWIAHFTLLVGIGLIFVYQTAYNWEFLAASRARDIGPSPLVDRSVLTANQPTTRPGPSQLLSSADTD